MAETQENLTKGRVIIPYGRSIMALVAAHSLGKKGAEIIGCDSVDFTVLSFSRYVTANFIYTDPKKDEEKFIADILAKVKKYKPEDNRPYVLMPVFNDTFLFAKYRDRLEEHIKIAAPDYNALLKLGTKDRFAETVKALGVPVPETRLPETRQELENIADEIEYPVLIKPYNQVGGRGIHKVDNSEELLTYWDKNLEKYSQKSLIQDFATGKDYCLTTLFENGELKASMAYRNLHRFPVQSGAGVMRETVDDTRFVDVACKLMKPLKWNGIAEFDFIWDECEESTPALIEVNTRFWGGLFQSVESGIDFPWMLYRLTVDGHVEKAGKASIGTKTKVPYVWLISAIKDVTRSDEKFEQIRQKGKTAAEKMKQGKFLDGLKDYSIYLTQYVTESFNFPRKIKQLQQAIKTGKQARNELFNGEDPYAAFGILFIIGSLIRHGHLPEELKF